MPETAPGERRDLPAELQHRVGLLSRRSAWEKSLPVALGIALVAMGLSLLLRSGILRFDVHAALFFGGLACVFLLAWFAAERARSATAQQFETVAESVKRHLSTEQALRDPLTGAYNRAALQELSRTILRRAERFGEPVTVAVLDLDHFHELNSIHGHIAGDLALVEFARILHSSTRGSDVVARYGGDEFVLMLSETPLAGAQVVINRLFDRVDKRNKQLSDGQIPLAFTAGAAQVEKGMDFSDLFREADFDLLRRKAARPKPAGTATR